jgi:hypothetical protein
MMINNITVHLYSPHPGQVPVHKSKARFRVVPCGRRFGKTYLGCNEIIKFACEHNSILGAWVSPTYRQSKIAYRLIKNALSSLASHKSDSELTLELPNGSRMMFCSSDNYDALRGNGIHFLVIDECADVDEKAWTEVLRPCLSDTRGMALFLGTPKGRNFFYMLYHRGLDAMYPDWESFRAPSSSNPYIPPEEIESARRELPEDAFAQEYLAEFLEESAGVFRRIDSIVEGTLDPDYSPEYMHEYVIGWDPAKYQDYSVITLMDATTRKVVWFDRFNQIDYMYQVMQVIAIAKKFNAFVLMDSTGAGDVVFELLREKYPNCDGYLFNNTSKKILIETLQLGIQDKAFTMPNILVVINELRQFEYHLSPSRNIIYSAPIGCHDDCVISLALVWFATQMREIQPLDADTSSALSQYVGY